MKQWLIAAMAGCAAMGVQAETLTVEMNKVNDQGIASAVGTVKIETTDQGLVFRPDLSGLNAGAHGFHVHANGSCQPAEKDGKPAAAVAAGCHWDPKNAGKHALEIGRRYTRRAIARSSRPSRGRTTRTSVGHTAA